MHQRDYCKNELEEITDFREQTAASSTSRQRNSFFEYEAEEYSFPDFGSDHDDVTNNYSPLNDLSPLRSSSLFDVSQRERIRLVKISFYTD